MTRASAKAIVLPFLTRIEEDPMCVCGLLFSEHGMGDNHVFVSFSIDALDYRPVIELSED